MRPQTAPLVEDRDAPVVAVVPPVASPLVVVLPGLVCAAVAAAWWLAGVVHPDPHVHGTALFVHLACLTLGFGSVLAVDWVAMLWLLGRRTFGDVLAAADNAHVPIWAGYAGLVASGVLLEPDLTRGLTLTKVALVLAIGANGAYATGLHRRLRSVPESGPDAALRLRCFAAATVSQCGWWGATAIGFLNAS